MSLYLPEQGDIVMIDFDPATGREIQKRRPALVMSKSIMAKHTGLVLVCPITSTVRGIELEVAVNGEKNQRCRAVCPAQVDGFPPP